VKAEDFVGTYEGRGQQYVAADGMVTPVGEKPATARLVYAADGTVIVISTPAGRARLPGRVSGNDWSGATAAEKAAATDGVVAYAGRYEVQADRVLHHVEISFFPNWVGTTNVRLFQWNGRMLTLSTPPDASGGIRRILWEKVA
jgi:hypothetical protein